jgi:hypothetical protein
MRRWWLGVTSTIGVLAMAGCAEEPRGSRDPGVFGGQGGAFDDGGDDAADGADDGEGDGAATDEGSTGEPDAAGGDVLAAGVWIGRIEANQAVGVLVGEIDAEVPSSGRTAELVASRTTLLQVGWLLEDDVEPRRIEARLELRYADGRTETLSDTKDVAAAADLSRPEGAFAWELAPEQVEPGMRYRVTLVETDGVARSGPTKGATFPPDSGDADLGVRSEQMAMTVVLIPVSTPEGTATLSPAQLEEIEARLLATYPVQSVELRVRQTWARSARLSSLDEAFNFMTSARMQDGESDAPYYHLVLDNSTCCSGADFEEWSGVANIVSDSLDWPRDGITKLYPEYGDFQWDVATLIHEIGHNHGRQHAPCGDPAGPDPGFPYAGAVLGARGYDIGDGTLIDPVAVDPEQGKPHTDFMSYCWPQWWSDYSWQALVDRVRLVTSQAAQTPGAPRWRLRGLARPGADVTWSWVRVPARTDIDDGPGTLTLVDAHGVETEVPVRVSSLGDTDVRILEADAPTSMAFTELEVRLPDGLRSRTPVSAMHVAP